MVLIKVDRVYELTILLCGLERGGGERGLRENAHASRLPDKKSGEFQREKKVQRGKGGREKCLWE